MNKHELSKQIDTLEKTIKKVESSQKQLQIQINNLTKLIDEKKPLKNSANPRERMEYLDLEIKLRTNLMVLKSNETLNHFNKKQLEVLKNNLKNYSEYQEEMSIEE